MRIAQLGLAADEVKRLQANVAVGLRGDLRVRLVRRHHHLRQRAAVDHGRSILRTAALAAQARPARAACGCWAPASRPPRRRSVGRLFRVGVATGPHRGRDRAGQPGTCRLHHRAGVPRRHQLRWTLAPDLGAGRQDDIVLVVGGARRRRARPARAWAREVLRRRRDGLD